jgi:hypothetical protein
MYSSLVKALAGSSLLIIGSFALQGQTYGQYPPYQGDPYYRDYRGPVYSSPYGDSNGMELFDQVRADLDHAGFYSHRARRRINHARKEVDDVQRQLSRGHFDSDEIDEAISGVQHVVNDDSISDMDRQNLLRDLAQMQGFRAAGGGRYRNPGYGYDRYYR